MNLLLAASTTTTQASSKTATGSSYLGTLVFLVLIGFVFYFLFIRPQRQRQRTQMERMAQIGEGDEVITQSGVIGTVVEILDDRYVLEVAPGVNMTFHKQFLLQRIEEPASVEEDAEEEDGGEHDSEGGEDA